MGRGPWRVTTGSTLFEVSVGWSRRIDPRAFSFTLDHRHDPPSL